MSNLLTPLRSSLLLLALFALVSGGLPAGALAAEKVAPAAEVQLPADILAPALWHIADQRGNTFSLGSDDGMPTLSADGRQLYIESAVPHRGQADLALRFRLKEGARLQVGMGIADITNRKERGHYVLIHNRSGVVNWRVSDPANTSRHRAVSGSYSPQFKAPRRLNWPEIIRASVEVDMAASVPLEERWLTLRILLKPVGYEVFLDGIPLTSVDHPEAKTEGHLRLTLWQGVELASMALETIEPVAEAKLFEPVSIQRLFNADSINGKRVDWQSMPGSGEAITVGGVPFELEGAGLRGNDHVDIGESWFRLGNLDGRFSGRLRGNNPLSGRWGGVMIHDPARIAVRLPMARYRALHFLAAADSEADSVPVLTAQFYRPASGFPKNFQARVPALTATSSAADALPVKLADGSGGKLYLVTIPIEPGALAEFDDLDYVEVELTKDVQLYRAQPDPMYYSYHAAGLPSSVHVFAMTAEEPRIDLDFAPGNYGDIWTAPQSPRYTLTLSSRKGEAREVQVVLETALLGGGDSTEQRHTVALPAGREDVTLALPIELDAYGYHDVKLTVIDGDQTWVEPRSLAYLHEDTRTRGDWDFGRGPLFGFWNWGGGHHTPSAEKQLKVMALAGIETTPGSIEQYIERHGEATHQIMKDYGIFTLKFIGSGDHYVTANFAKDLRAQGLDAAREKFLKTIEGRKSAPGPLSRPLFLSFYPEPSLGPVTHGIFPQFIDLPPVELTESEQARYKLYRDGFVEGARIIREHYPEVKNLLPHGDPTFVVHFLHDPEVVKLLDGITIDIPAFERLPEQQFHQVSLHRLYMARSEMAKVGITDPLLPMYEGPCIPSGPGALTLQEQADLTIRNSIMLMVYGIYVQNGGFPAFDTASYWGEQHYGSGVLNRIALETPKPAYTALATLTRHLNRMNFNKYLDIGSTSTFALQFKHYKTGQLAHVLWTVRGSRPVTIDVPSGQDVKVYDQNDNLVPLQVRDGKATFVIDQSPCYVHGLSGDMALTLGEPDHSDAAPAKLSKKIGNFGDGTWTITSERDLGYEESHTPYIYRFQSPLTGKVTDAPQAQGGKALAVHLEEPQVDRVFTPYYSILRPAEPVAIPGKASHIGVWVRAASDWGRIVYFARDAKGEQWISVGTAGAWNCDDLHSWTSFNFDGWRYLTMEMPANSAYDTFREAGRTWWGAYSEGDQIVDLPLSLEKVAIERRTDVMYVDSPVPASQEDVLLGDLYVEYAAAEDMSADAVRISALRRPMPENVPPMANPIADLMAEGTHPAVAVTNVTLPTHGADGTRCYVHFEAVEGATAYDVWVAPYASGAGALQLGKDWKEPGGQIRGLRPDTDFYLFVTYTGADGKESAPSEAYKIRLEDFFGMK